MKKKVRIRYRMALCFLVVALMGQCSSDKGCTTIACSDSLTYNFTSSIGNNQLLHITFKADDKTTVFECHTASNGSNYEDLDYNIACSDLQIVIRLLRSLPTSVSIEVKQPDDNILSHTQNPVPYIGIHLGSRKDDCPPNCYSASFTIKN